ncbi:MAG: DEAD/DEAH box helicase [Chitinophagaceae bacterium]
MTFKELGLNECILKALNTLGYTIPTPIQEQSIPILLKGKDLLGCAQTGTGKTAAFAIPILQQMFEKGIKKEEKRKIKTLVLTPTRELALQIEESFTDYGKHTGLYNTVIFGGVKQGLQVSALKRGVDILIATPGRLLDLINQGFVSLNHIEYFVLDEADQMLDMGFIHDIKKIIKLLPVQRQSLFFSATMAPNIIDLSKQILGKPEQVTITPEKTTAEKVDQTVYFVSKPNKIKLLIHLMQKENIQSALIFSRTKHGADKLVKLLKRSEIHAAAIHGNKSQPQRQKALSDFKDGKLNVLVATDIAARGIDIDELSHVINYDLPNVAESYVHRIGRTGRANKSGIAISFCDAEERAYLKDIQKLIKKELPVITEQPFVDETPQLAPEPERIKKIASNQNKRKFHFPKKASAEKAIKNR